MRAMLPLRFIVICSAMASFQGAATASRPAAASAPASRRVFSRKEFDDHIRDKVNKLIPGPEFRYCVEQPFVVISDAGPEELERYVKKTVRWAVNLLRNEYFSKDPARILDVWLFKDKESYEKHIRLIFHDEPTTPFGYYSSRDDALIMNIATGGGTLVHEIVHPFIEANFPACPSWLNEGLGSLYEQCEERDRRIRGRTNWRLAGLQEALRKGDDVLFEEFTAQTTQQFYADRRGVNYAQARYLCYYLQEKGLLNKFYHDFHAAAATDPTGYKTLCATLGKPDMKEFYKTWREFSLNLKFP